MLIVEWFAVAAQVGEEIQKLHSTLDVRSLGISCCEMQWLAMWKAERTVAGLQPQEHRVLVRGLRLDLEKAFRAPKSM